jgi:hypothetical protein
MFKKSLFIKLFLIVFLSVLLGPWNAKADLIDEQIDNYLLVRQNVSNQQVLKTINSRGEENFIAVIKSNLKISVILPFIYLHDEQKLLLNVYDVKGTNLLTLNDCKQFSANAQGILSLSNTQQLKIYSIKDQKISLVSTVLENVSKFKISDNVIVVSKNNAPSLESFSLNHNRQNIFPVVTQGWNQLNNISSIAFNKNFMVTKDWQQLTRISNIQGNSITLGRGAIKNFILTKNHFIAHYGNDKVEVFNAYDKQFILTLPQVFTVKTTKSLTSFKWNNEITIVNERGEIFTLLTPQQSKFSQGENFYAMNNGNHLFIYNSSGEQIWERKFEKIENHLFMGDFLCLQVKINSSYSCINTQNPNQSLISIDFKDDDFNVGLHQWGFYQHNLDDQILQITLENGVRKTFGQVIDVYAPNNLYKNEYNFFNF